MSTIKSTSIPSNPSRWGTIIIMSVWEHVKIFLDSINIFILH